MGEGGGRGGSTAHWRGRRQGHVGRRVAERASLLAPFLPFLWVFLWLRRGELWPWSVLSAFVLACFGFVGQLRTLRVARARKAALAPHEHELSGYVVHPADEEQPRRRRDMLLLRTTNEAVELWQGGDRRWRRPWTDLAFSRAWDDRHREILVLEAAATARDGAPAAVRLRLAPVATAAELLLAARRKGATVRETG